MTNNIHREDIDGFEFFHLLTFVGSLFGTYKHISISGNREYYWNLITNDDENSRVDFECRSSLKIIVNQKENTYDVEIQSNILTSQENKMKLYTFIGYLTSNNVTFKSNLKR